MRRLPTAIVGLAACTSDLAAPPSFETSTGLGESSSTAVLDPTASNESSSTTAEVPACTGAWSQLPELRGGWDSPQDPQIAIGYALALAQDGDIVVAHASRYNPPTTYEDAFVVRYDSAGTVRWVDRYAGSGLDDHPLGVAVDGFGRVYALVRENLSEVHAESWTFVDSRLVVLAYDVDGAHRWRWELESEPPDPTWPNDQRHGLLAIDREDHLQMLATGDLNSGITELVLVELDGFGNVIRNLTTAGGGGVDLLGFALASNGEARVLTNADVDYQPGGKVFAIAEDGSIRVTATLTGPHYDIEAFALGPSDELVLVGNSHYEGEGIGFAHGFAADGTPSFAIVDGLPRRVERVAIDCDGTIVVARSDVQKIEFVAFDPDGERLWSLELPTVSGSSSRYSLALAISEEARTIAAIGWADLVVDDPGTAPWLALFDPR